MELNLFRLAVLLWTAYNMYYANNSNSWLLHEIKNLAIFFPFPSKQFLPIHTAETMLVSILTHPPPSPTPRVLTEPVLWQKSLAGTGKQTAKTWFGLEK